MEEYLSDGDAGWTAQINAVIQASTRQAYHISGGKITPGTSNTDISVSVDAGAASVNGTRSEWSATELILEQGGVGPSSSDQNQPRVDAIFAKENGTLGVATGVPESFSPDETPDGQPYTPSPFEHWTPAPDSGARIGGCLLGFVLVGKDFTNAADVPAENIRQWKIGEGTDSSTFVRGDGTPNGPTTIAVNDDPVTIDDTAASGDGFFRYNPQAGEVVIGSGGDAQVALGSQLDTNNVRFLFDSSRGTWSFWDTATGSPVLSFGANVIGAKRSLDMANNEILNTKKVRTESVWFQSGSAHIFEQDNNGHLIYEAPNGTVIDLTPNEGNLS